MRERERERGGKRHIRVYMSTNSVAGSTENAASEGAAENDADDLVQVEGDDDVDAEDAEYVAGDAAISVAGSTEIAANEVEDEVEDKGAAEIADDAVQVKGAAEIDADDLLQVDGAAENDADDLLQVEGEVDVDAEYVAEDAAVSMIVVDNATSGLLINSPATWAIVHGDVGAIQLCMGRGAPRTHACWNVPAWDDDDDGNDDENEAIEAENEDEEGGSIIVSAGSMYTDTFADLDSVEDRLRERADSAAAAGASDWSAVHLAARQGSAYTVLALLQAGEYEHALRQRRFGADLEYAYAPFATPLVDAVSRRRLSAAKCLLRYRNQPLEAKSTESDDYQALQEATRTSCKSTVRLLLRHKVSTNWPTLPNLSGNGQDWRRQPRGATPLFLAANCLFSSGCVGLLLAAKACANALNHDGLGTPLHGAAASGCTSSVHQLLAARSDILARDACGRTPIDVASAAGHTSVLASLLAAAPLDWLIGNHPADASLDQTPHLLSSPTCHQSSPTCLHVASVNQRTHCVATILQAASAQSRARAQLVMLVHERLLRMNRVQTTSDAWVRIASMICIHPVVDARDQDGNTALALAVSVLNPGIVQQLLCARADPLSANCVGDNPLTAADRATAHQQEHCATAHQQEHCATAHQFRHLSLYNDAIRCRAILADACVQRARARSNPIELLWRRRLG